MQGYHQSHSRLVVVVLKGLSEVHQLPATEGVYYYKVQNLGTALHLRFSEPDFLACLDVEGRRVVHLCF